MHFATNGSIPVKAYKTVPITYLGVMMLIQISM